MTDKAQLVEHLYKAIKENNANKLKKVLAEIEKGFGQITVNYQMDSRQRSPHASGMASLSLIDWAVKVNPGLSHEVSLELSNYRERVSRKPALELNVDSKGQLITTPKPASKEHVATENLALFNAVKGDNCEKVKQAINDRLTNKASAPLQTAITFSEKAVNRGASSTVMSFSEYAVTQVKSANQAIVALLAACEYRDTVKNESDWKASLGEKVVSLFFHSAKTSGQFAKGNIFHKQFKAEVAKKLINAALGNAIITMTNEELLALGDGRLKTIADDIFKANPNNATLQSIKQGRDTAVSGKSVSLFSMLKVG